MRELASIDPSPNRQGDVKLQSSVCGPALPGDSERTYRYQDFFSLFLSSMFLK